jgi:hypothetical protein
MERVSPLDWAGGSVRSLDAGIDQRCKKYTLDNVLAERLCPGFRWAEGAVYFGDAHCLRWALSPRPHTAGFRPGHGRAEAIHLAHRLHH